ncbi:hypothetical protein L1987_22518 [Smallanthus sonchifolius]|uniref:Uncharacterized protein n=1 Tax=Smallanthus sonchifolius TaxID=185202 RepID=A0ACB9IFZ9_9ASTR|nr:hypothetical protein L1987_22518 [Smallanthus sonchifolius]
MSQVCSGLKRSGKCSFGKKLIEWMFCPDSNGTYRCMHTRGSKKLSPLAFDPEIERTLSRNRVLLRENKVIGSPTTPKNTMDPPILTTGQTLPTTTPPIPSSPITNESKPTNTTVPTSTLPPNPLSYQTTSTFPPFSHFFPTQGQSSSQQSQPFPFQQDPPITFTTPVQQQQSPSRFQYQQSPVMPFMRVQDDGFDGGYEDEYEGYDEGEYTLGGNGNQTGFQGGGGFVRKPQDIPQAPQGQPRQVQQYEQQVPQQQQVGQMFQPPTQQFAPQRPVQRPMGPPHPRVRLGVPRRYNREAVRGIEAHFRPVITNNPSPVVIPQNNQGRTFEVRTNSLQSLPKYKGLATEEPYFHLEAYDSICNTIGGQGFSSDEVKLVLFQFSLEDKAKRWFYTLPSASIYTWAEMQQRFLEEFFTAQKTNDARRSLRSFQQQQGEMFHEAFERFNLMIKNCPHHGIELWELLNAFHEGLNSEDARDLMSITNGTFGTNHEQDDWAFLEQMAVTSKRKAQSSRRARPTITRTQVHAVEDGNVQTTNQVYDVCTNCNELGHRADVCLVGVVEGQYEGVNAIQGQGQGGGGRNYNMNSNTYHPGLRNHPNFRYGNPANQSNPNFQGAPQSNFVPRQPYANQGNQGYQRQYQQQTGGPGPSNSSGNEVIDMLRMMQQDMQRRNQLDEVRMQKDEVRDKSIQSLTTQMGQLATEVAELKKGKGQLPSDTKVNPSHSSSRNIPINHVSVLRSGKEFKANLSPGLVDGVVEDITGNESDEDEISPSIVSKDPIVEKEIKKPGLGEILKDKNKEGGPSQVPFPSALIDPGKKNFISTRGPQKEEMWEVFKQVKVNLPLLEAIKQVPAYAKFLKELCTQKRQQKVPKQVNLTERVSAVLKGDLPPKLQDPGTPLINIQVGNFQMSRALLDLGAGVSILPGDLYDQYDFGPLKRVETTVVLADLSHKLPRGIVRDVIVKVEEFYYPVDFLVLDYSSVDPSQQQNVILGRPFLNTAHAIIDCRYGTVDMTFGNRKKRLNVFTNVSNSLGGDECFMADLVDRCDPHEYEEDVLETCVCDFSEQVQICALRMEEKKQEALAVREGRPPWTHQIESLPVEINSGTKPSLEEPPTLELKDLPSHLKYAFLGDNDTLPVIIASNLEKAQEQALLKVLKANKEAIGWTIADLKGISPSIVMHKIITTEDAKPTREAQRRLNPNLRDVVKKEVIKWLDADGYSGYNQIAIHPDDQHKTTFTCPYGTFAFRRMPFGLCNAPATFQRCMMSIFSDMVGESLEVFMDDFSIFGTSFESCLDELEKVLKRCVEKNLVLSWEKSHFMVQEDIVLGHIISEKGMEVDKAKIRAISSLHPPKNVKGGQLVKAPILQPPDWSKPFEIMCDASDTTIGAVLGQRIDKKPVAIYYASKTLSEAQLNYTTTEKELLAVVYALDKFRSYIWGSKVIVYSEYSAVRYLMEKKDAKPRLIRWVLLLQEFDLEIRDKKGSENVVADHLSRIPLEGVDDVSEIN